MAVARSPLRRRPTSSVTAANEVSAGTASRTIPCLAHASISAGWHYVKVSGIVLTLTKTAAGALDATFGTSLFTAGLELGTASTTLRY